VTPIERMIDAACKPVTSPPTKRRAGRVPRGAILPANLRASHLDSAINAWCIIAAEIGVPRKPGDPGMCAVATDHFLWFLDGCAGGALTAGVLTLPLDDPTFRAIYPVNVGTYRCQHVVAVVGNVAIDWTARQFDAGAPCPLVWLLPTVGGDRG